MNQAKLEAHFSQKRIHGLLRERCREELNGFFLHWALGTWLRLIDYLETRTYDSKNTRKQELKDMFEKDGMEDTILNILVAVFRGRKDQPLQQVIGYLVGFMPHESVWDNVKTAGELVALGTRGTAKGLYCLTRNENGKPYIEVNYWPQIQELLGEVFEEIDLTMFNPPLIERPLVVTDNRSIGYHTTRDSLILGTHTHHDWPLDYITINTLNDIKYKLDLDVLAEEEIAPSILDTTDKVEQHNRMVAQSRKLYDLLDDRPFHLVWQYDSRGRIYSHGYHINLQGYEYKKALLNFEQEEYL